MAAVGADLVVTDARLANGARVTLRIAAGRFVAIEPAGAGAVPAGALDARGALALPGFVDGHVHLDKTYLGLPWMSNESGLGIAERVAYEREMEKRIDHPVATRAGALIERMVAHGTTCVRAHVDIDPDDRLRRLEGLLEAREKYRDAIDMQIVAFPQMGVVKHSGMVTLLDDALAAGADLLGGIDPGTVDRDVPGQLDALFALAERRGVGLDLHLHTPGSLGIHELEELAARTAKYRMGGKVVGSHCHSLGDATPAVQDATTALLAEAGVAVFNYGPGWLPLPPLARMHAAGVTVFSGSDNVRDAWQPYGTGDMLERAWIVGYRSGFRSDKDFALAHAMTTGLAAKACGFADHGLRVGADGDLVLVDAETAAEAICTRPVRKAVVKRGRVVARDGSYLG